MTRTPLRDLMGFARQSGFDATRCPSCSVPTAAGERSGSCGNCGGSGRLWTSSRGSLSDEGLRQLQRMHGNGIAAEKFS